MILIINNLKSYYLLMIILVILLIYLVIMVFNKTHEPFKDMLSSTKTQLNDSRFRKNIDEWWPLVERSNQLVKGWVLTFVPNVGWVYKLGDKFIEYQRAKNGLPPMKRSSAGKIHLNINSSNKRYRFW